MRSITALSTRFARLNSIYSFARDLSRSIHTSPFNSRTSTIIIGAVSYSDNVSSIWEGIRQHYVKRGIALDFILFTSYERQIEYLMSGHIDIAWNGPIAHARLQRLVKNTISLGMRDVDRDFAACILCTKKSGIKNIRDIESKRLATGSFDSPQAYILPMHHLISSNINLSSVDVVRYDKDIGKHGDTAVGELDVINALRNGSCDAGFVSKMMLDRMDTTSPGQDTLDIDGIIHIPVFDHCQFDALSSLSKQKRDSFQSTLLEMDMNNEEDRVVMMAEGIKERWMPARESGYDTVRAAISKEDICVSPAPYSIGNNPFKSLSVISD